jgi:hypothetical protein
MAVWCDAARSATYFAALRLATMARQRFQGVAPGYSISHLRFYIGLQTRAKAQTEAGSCHRTTRTPPVRMQLQTVAATNLR